ncbi:hypothetical protein H2248_001203 [Termitomyces sp. 'cryptogamus']|nr:hypothetical protein H2248_001203 [Termitomyces sp. 'cryptogamus']
MFTGLIEHLGTVLSIVRDEGGCTLTIGDCGAILGDCHVGDSIAVDGACLTVTGFDKVERGGWFSVWLANETLARTDLGERREGEEVNLERAMGADGRFGGHFVQVSVWKWRWAWLMCAGARGRDCDGGGEGGGRGLAAAVVWAGGRGAAGVDDGQGTFDVMLIQHTQATITLGKKAVGARVNVEVDMVAKYVQKSVQAALAGNGR